MALFKNGKPYDVPKEFLKDFDKTEIFELHPSLWWYDEVNKRNRTSASQGRENVYSYYDDKEKKRVEIRYTKAFVELENGKRRYSDPYFYFEHGNPIFSEVTDPDLYYFMFNHPLREGSPYRDEKQNPLFVLQDKQKAASYDVHKIKARKDAYKRIYDEMNEHQVREFAKSLQYHNVDNVSIDEVYVLLENDIDQDPVSFLKKCIGKDVNLMALINEAQEHRVIRLEAKKLFLLDSEGNPAEKICGHSPTQDALIALSTFLKERDTDNWLGRLSKIVEQKKKALAGAEVEA